MPGCNDPSRWDEERFPYRGQGVASGWQVLHPWCGRNPSPWRYRTLQENDENRTWRLFDICPMENRRIRSSRRSMSPEKITPRGGLKIRAPISESLLRVDDPVHAHFKELRPVPAIVKCSTPETQNAAGVASGDVQMNSDWLLVISTGCSASTQVSPACCRAP